MNTNWIAIVGAPALVAPLLFCTVDGNDAAASDPHGGLERVGAQTPAAFDAQAWKERLSTHDLEERERAFERLIEQARGDDAARKQLEAWAHDEHDAGLAWTSRMALRELRTQSAQSGPFGWSGPRGPRGGNLQGGNPQGFDDLRSRFEDLQDRFGGLDNMFEDMQREMDRALQAMPHQGFPGPGVQGNPGQGLFRPGPGSANSQSKSYSMRVEPDGVKVEVSEDVDGKKETKTYSAKTLEELYAAHPELRDQFGMHIQVGPGSGLSDPDGPFAFRGRQDNPLGTWGPLVPNSPGRPAIPLDRGAFRTDVLGVQVDTPSAEERRLAKVGEGVGLKVESVQPGTIAARIGVQAGDLVVDVNGHEVKSVEDVRDTLRARKDGEDVAVTVVDENGERRVLTWRAGAEEKRSERRF